MSKVDSSIFRGVDVWGARVFVLRDDEHGIIISSKPSNDAVYEKILLLKADEAKRLAEWMSQFLKAEHGKA